MKNVETGISENCPLHNPDTRITMISNDFTEHNENKPDV